MKLIDHDDTFCESRFYSQKHRYGSTVTMCVESFVPRENGELWVTSEKSESQVNYCPYCGFRAKVQMKEINR